MTTIDYNQGETVYFRGQPSKVVSSQGGYVTLEFLGGKQLSVRATELMKTSLWEYREKQKEEREEAISHYQELAETAGVEKKNWFEKMHDLWSQMLGLDKSDDQYAQLKDEYWHAKIKKTAASNSEYSYYMSAFMVASDPIT